MTAQGDLDRARMSSRVSVANAMWCSRRRPGPVVGVDEVVGLLPEVQPLRGDGAIVEHDLLGDPAAERAADEVPFGRACAARKFT
jgi:hypothetical protein